jgi:hypothetical protein
MIALYYAFFWGVCRSFRRPAWTGQDVVGLNTSERNSTSRLMSEWGLSADVYRLISAGNAKSRTNISILDPSDPSIDGSVSAREAYDVVFVSLRGRQIALQVSNSSRHAALLA